MDSNAVLRYWLELEWLLESMHSRGFAFEDNRAEYLEWLLSANTHRLNSNLDSALVLVRHAKKHFQEDWECRIATDAEEEGMLAKRKVA